MDSMADVDNYSSPRVMLNMKVEAYYLSLLFLILLDAVSSWVSSGGSSSSSSTPPRQGPTSTTTTQLLQSTTPFEADFYNSSSDDDDDNPYASTSSPSRLAVDDNTKLVVGLNKYSHDTAICAAEADTGQVLFALSKERLTRKKHDAGNAASVVESCLEALDLQLENIVRVVVNNHHHRVLPVEDNIRHMEWECGLQINGGVEAGYDEPENLLQHCEDRQELSHHLAHAYSTATQAPFNSGLVAVLDGMGETYRTMMTAKNDPAYTSDFSLVDVGSGSSSTIQIVPSDLTEKAVTSRFDWREAESIYTFRKTTSGRIEIIPIFKRFTPENSPPTLYNHGFENMDSVGALYSRASSHIFGDWNACGKVMGLAPWANHAWTMTETGEKLAPKLHETPILKGKLYEEKSESKLQIGRSLMEGLPFIARTDPDLFEQDGTQKKLYDFDDNDGDNDDVRTKIDKDSDKIDDDTGKRTPASVALDAIALAHRMQIDLEAVVMDFVRHFKQETGEINLCIAGGVGLNSVLNGRLARELGFEQTFISPYPGDDGIAIGCCAFGLFGPQAAAQSKEEVRPKVWNEPLSPYMGPDPSEADIKEAIEYAAPWLEVEAIRNEEQRLEMMAQEVETGAVIAWYRSRSEMGPRALGHRSILADPRKKGMVRFINEHVKNRESFRPFAPSVLAEEAINWFDLGENVPSDGNASPYMSMTAMVHDDKRASIPAVTHVDGSSRLQTVTKKDEPTYHKFILKFFELTGVPMVLNTSFNTLPSEPIVETPQNAIRSFLYSMGSIELLVMGDYMIRRKKPDLQKLLGKITKDGELKVQPACPKRAGAVSFSASFDLGAGETDESSVETVTRVRMPDRPMHGNKNEWFELLDDLEGEILSVCDGTITMNEIMAQYLASPEGTEIGEDEVEATQNLLQNIVYRMSRLFDHTLIGW